ncbi:MAG: HAMP domain-containing protein [Bauldia sp.]|nr:HAMP domain-containing protein [Bauldia sp.]
MTLSRLSLGGQLIALLLAALVLAQALSFVVFTDDREQAVRAANRAGLLENMASVVHILEKTPPAGRAALAEAATTPRVRYWVSDSSATPEGPRSSQLSVPALQFERLFVQLREAPRLAVIDSDGVRERPPAPRDQHDDDGRRGGGRPPPFNGGQFDVLASVPFADGGWLNAQTRIRAEPVPIPWPSLISAGLMAVAILVIVGLIVRRATRPIAALADRVEAFGRGAPSVTLPESGPREVRRLTAAFNRMQDRLARFIADRTRMLAAIGHDLRTPITSLKIRTELLDDEEAKAKMMQTLDDMQRMTEATLAFAREDADAEPLRTVDLDALVESLCDDLAAMGQDVAYDGAGRLPYPCRPTALRRAVGNLVENAVRYGDRARVALKATVDGPLLTVEDDGPGIPAERIEEVYKPFVRLETSRSRETGGSGLGLSIARSIILAHGGELTLSNRKPVGLRAEIRLPPAVRE